MPSPTYLSTATAASYKWELTVRSHGLWEALAESVRTEGLDPLQMLGWMKTAEEPALKLGDAYTIVVVPGDCQIDAKRAVAYIKKVSIGKQWKELLNYNDNIGLIFHHKRMRRSLTGVPRTVTMCRTHHITSTYEHRGRSSYRPGLTSSNVSGKLYVVITVSKTTDDVFYISILELVQT
ncbi:uncharacterized protein LOC127250960 [Andrographis paniculata]|uniref:uncharacterized protein LOC127250960 n=1 Tax=Andrographis paniculata TaxID=175694 RepID=UPI0021E93A9A|nr:uncharacterized protein LOC127250960 [Andrographis paniculata]